MREIFFGRKTGASVFGKNRYTGKTGSVLEKKIVKMKRDRKNNSRSLLSKKQESGSEIGWKTGHRAGIGKLTQRRVCDDDVIGYLFGSHGVMNII